MSFIAGFKMILGSLFEKCLIYCYLKPFILKNVQIKVVPQISCLSGMGDPSALPNQLSVQI